MIKKFILDDQRQGYKDKIINQIVGSNDRIASKDSETYIGWTEFFTYWIDEASDHNIYRIESLGIITDLSCRELETRYGIVNLNYRTIIEE